MYDFSRINGWDNPLLPDYSQSIMKLETAIDSRFLSATLLLHDPKDPKLLANPVSNFTFYLLYEGAYGKFRSSVGSYVWNASDGLRNLTWSDLGIEKVVNDSGYIVSSGPLGSSLDSVLGSEGPVFGIGLTIPERRREGSENNTFYLSYYALGQSRESGMLCQFS